MMWCVGLDYSILGAQKTRAKQDRCVTRRARVVREPLV
jgi:hypothetical protein